MLHGQSLEMMSFEPVNSSSWRHGDDAALEPGGETEAVDHLPNAGRDVRCDGSGIAPGASIA
ncbi:hypothetical protein VSDG_03488 [Cytospora chrysosperma]|uniref:Uncharacterized protein n=1 Tax=Cytospora chrysosperma TaxID=252740 RepID=A0A423W9Z1_CYTCH|nr:hypothetical protein VSDG_03488 [Valsa sordida]